MTRGAPSLQVLLVVAATLVTAVSCSSSESSGTSSPCGEQEAGLPTEAECLQSVSGRVLDETGSPVPELDVTVCGPICFRSRTAGDGVFAVEVGRYVIVSEYSVQPHGRPDRSTFYYPLGDTLPEPNLDVGDLRVVPFEAASEPLVIKLDDAGAPAQSATSGGITLGVPEGTSLVLDVNDAFLGDEGKRFRATRVDDALVAEFAPELDARYVYALGPFEAEFRIEGTRDPSLATLSFDNDGSLPPGEELEVLALGTYLDPQWLTPARFESVGTARVSGDGSKIEMTRSTGIRWITWVALR